MKQSVVRFFGQTKVHQVSGANMGFTRRLKENFTTVVSLVAIIAFQALADELKLPRQGIEALCMFADVSFDADFAGGSLNSCARREDGSYELRFAPENTPINHSPWYAFRVSSSKDHEIVVHLSYTHHRHRYWPKLSADGERWQRASIGAVAVDESSGTASLRLSLVGKPIWVAGQELFDNEDYFLWAKDMEAQGVFASSILGKSAQGRDILKLEYDAGTGRFIALTGRQHPPEVTGALALEQFVDRLGEDDKLATVFREHFGVLVVPNMNPDGVALGYWRHSTGGIDLNRDWGPFTQPETALLRDEFSRFREGSSESLALFLDFHSTRYDVLYTQLRDMPTRPANFTWSWIARLQRALSEPYPGYPVTVKPGHNPDRPTSKAYMHATFGVPAITFELGDETDREFLRGYARIAAEQMMIELLGTL